jgi:hypothetical protein
MNATRWAVTVSVDGAVIRAYNVVATTQEAAIGKAKRKMRGAVSTAGEFVYHATQIGTVVLGEKQ